MPQYDEDMQRRRQKREAQRKKREAEAKHMKRMLILAVFVLVLCGVGIYLLVQRMGGSEESVQAFQQAAQTEAPTLATRATSPAQQSPTTTIHIKAAGDLNITDSVITSGLTAGGYDYSSAFKDVAAILSDADLTVMNFEGNVCGEPYGTETTSAPAEILQGLRAAGVDLLQMANSCSINNGLNGLNATLRAIRNAGIEPLGAYSSASEFRASKGYTITEVQGIKVAFVAFTKGLGGRGMPAGNENLVNLLYTDYATEYQKVDKERIETILKNVEAEKPDITVAMLHWGSEYNDDISKSQGTIISLLQKNGADVIIGTHPHLVQPIVYDEVAGTLVAYSLGDFFGDGERGGTNYSIILDIEITKDSSTGVTKVTDYSYTPIYTVKPADSEGDYSYSRVMRIEKALEAYNDNFLDKVTVSCAAGMEKALTRIEERLVMPSESE
ncbi:MAG: CapA family protein [Faecousia sp.]